MDELARHKLIAIIQLRGLEVLEDPGAVKGLLADQGLGRYSRERSVLLVALEETVPQQLLSKSRLLPLDIVIGQLTRHLQDTRAIEAAAARWAVESWALAVGLTLSTPTAPAEKPQLVVTPVTTSPPPTLIPLIPPTSTGLRIAADGTGDFLTLEEALAKATPGTILHLNAGTYYLPQTISIKQSLTLIGAGQKATLLIGQAPDLLFTLTGNSTIALSNLTLKREGPAGDLIYCSEKIQLSLTRCRLEGARTPPKGWGVGLLLDQQSHATVQECTFTDNQGAGLTALDQAGYTVENSDFTHNGYGITLWGKTTGEIRHNLCSHNHKSGIYVDQQAQPTLTGNRCQENQEAGIVIFGSAGGSAVSNVCNHNEKYGIYVDQEAQPRLQQNQCQENRGSGITYGGKAGGTANGNLCHQNRKHGIELRAQAAPELTENSCRKNNEVGICYGETTGGIARRNHCADNLKHGIYLKDRAQPLLEENTCQNNGWSGIYYYAQSGGTARNNRCLNNASHGIYIHATAGPRLDNNQCQGNRAQNYTDERP